MNKSLKKQVWNQIQHKVHDYVWDKVSIQFWYEVVQQEQVRDQFKDQVHGKILDKICNRFGIRFNDYE